MRLINYYGYLFGVFDKMLQIRPAYICYSVNLKIVNWRNPHTPVVHIHNAWHSHNGVARVKDYAIPMVKGLAMVFAFVIVVY